MFFGPFASVYLSKCKYQWHIINADSNEFKNVVTILTYLARIINFLLFLSFKHFHNFILINFEVVISFGWIIHRSQRITIRWFPNGIITNLISWFWFFGVILLWFCAWVSGVSCWCGFLRLLYFSWVCIRFLYAWSFRLNNINLEIRFLVLIFNCVFLILKVLLHSSLSSCFPFIIKFHCTSFSFAIVKFRNACILIFFISILNLVDKFWDHLFNVIFLWIWLPFLRWFIHTFFNN